MTNKYYGKEISTSAGFNINPVGQFYFSSGGSSDEHNILTTNNLIAHSLNSIYEIHE